MNSPSRFHLLTASTLLTILTAPLLTGQVDASIPLRVNPPQVPNLTDTIIRLQQLKLQQQRAEEQARIAENARREAEQNRLRQSQPAEAVHLTMKQIMPADVFAATGLQKLEPQEIAMLDAWITLYSINLEKIFRTPAAPSSDNAIETKLTGDFEGWSGDTVFKLENGQIWQQSSYAYTYHYSYRPDVLIFRSGGVYKMKVADVSETIEVKRIK